jgi:signal peptidase I
MQTNVPLPSKRRKPLLALFLSLILPGYGQLYNGEVNKAIWLFLCLALLTVPMVAVIALYLPSGWMLPAFLSGLVLVLGVWLYGMVDAFRSARRQADYVLKSWQHSGMYVLVFLLCTAVTLPLLINYVRQHQVESFLVPSGSMEPTVMTGDMFFADKRYNCPGCKAAVQRGDIIVFIYPNDRTQYFIKRVIGLPGDKLQISGTDVFINGKSLKTLETPLPKGIQVTETDGKATWQVVWTTDGKNLPQTDLTIPAGSVFVMGDNRSASHDSRFIGTVPLLNVVGKARQVWLSLDNKAQHVRWERSGKVLE